MSPGSVLSARKVPRSARARFKAGSLARGRSACGLPVWRRVWVDGMRADFIVNNTNTILTRVHVARIGPGYFGTTHDMWFGGDDPGPRVKFTHGACEVKKQQCNVKSCCTGYLPRKNIRECLRNAQMSHVHLNVMMQCHVMLQ